MPEAPQKLCDLVLKGGVTSGVAFPNAVAKIAGQFSLVGIGGTSAGAIASCAAAAAEFRRREGGGFAGYTAFQEVGEELQREGVLKGLFQPDARTRKLFKLAQRGTNLDKLNVFAQLWWGVRVSSKLLRKKGLNRWMENGNGLVTGMANGNRNPSGPPPLTEWMADVFDAIAWEKPAGELLLFRHLWQAKPAPLQPKPTDPDLKTWRSIDLRAYTTCLSHQRPERLPFHSGWEADREDGEVFGFEERRWRELFPKRVVDWLVDRGEALLNKHEGDGIDGERAKALRAAGLLPLCTGGDLPVVVAARMSLSFPVLFTPIPLHGFDRALAEDGPGELKPLWFSDGGITSNFPIHSFDSLYPRWPTLAIGLQSLEDGRSLRKNTVNGVSTTRSVGDRLYPLTRRVFADDSGRGNAAGLIWKMFTAAQNWRDTSAMDLPGSRDRIAEVWLAPGEGGLNLDMPTEVIQKIAAKGEAAAQCLVDRFQDAATGQSSGPLPKDPAPNWHTHRIMRLRAMLDAVGSALTALARNEKAPIGADPGLQKLWESLQSPDFMHRFPDEASQQALAKLEQLAKLGAELSSWEHSDAPLPETQARTTLKW